MDELDNITQWVISAEFYRYLLNNQSMGDQLIEEWESPQVLYHLIESGKIIEDIEDVFEWDQETAINIGKSYVELLSIIAKSLVKNDAEENIAEQFQKASGLVSNWLIENEFSEYFSIDKNGVLFSYDDCLSGVVTLPLNVKKIDDEVFKDVCEVTEFVLPEGLKEIGQSAFCGCKDLKTVNIPSSVRKIGDFAFSGCENLSKVVISEGVTDILNYAFDECPSLKTLTIPSTVRNIGSSICRAKVKVSEENKWFVSQGYVLFSKDMKTLYVYPSSLDKARYDIPEGVERIGDFAFEGCTSLRQISIPKTANVYGRCILNECRHLQEIHIRSPHFAWEDEGYYLVEHFHQYNFKIYVNKKDFRYYRTRKEYKVFKGIHVLKIPDINLSPAEMTRSEMSFIHQLKTMDRVEIKGVKAPHTVLLLMTFMKMMDDGLIKNNTFIINDMATRTYDKFWNDNVKKSPFVKLSIEKALVDLIKEPFCYMDGQRSMMFEDEVYVVLCNMAKRKNIENVLRFLL